MASFSPQIYCVRRIITIFSHFIEEKNEQGKLNNLARFLQLESVIGKNIGKVKNNVLKLIQLRSNYKC